MYIIIIGCGTLGRGIARELSCDENNVVVIDRDINKLERLNEGFDGIRMKGIEFDNDILKEAGIENADVFLAVSSDDNTNILASKIAKEIYGVKKVISRVCIPGKEVIYKSLDIEVIKPTQLAINSLKDKIAN